MVLELDSTNQKMALIFDFFKRNETIFTIIAIFGALAGFLYNFKTGNDENLVSGILFLVILIGLLMLLILYDALMIVISFTKQNDGNFNTAFQVYFIGLCMTFFLLFFFSLITYLYSNYSDLILWFGILIFWSFFHYMGDSFNKFLDDSFGTTTRGIVIILTCYVTIFIFILTRIYPLLIVAATQSVDVIIITHTAQIVVFLGIILLHSLGSIFYFAGPLIKLRI